MGGMNIRGFGAAMLSFAGVAASASAAEIQKQAEAVESLMPERRFAPVSRQHWETCNPGSIAEHNRDGGPHMHSRERARRLFKPGPERRAVMTAWTGRAT